MESGTRRRSQTRLVFSDVHENRPCTNCTLCKETYVQYAHPVRWKNPDLLTFLRSIEPDLPIQPDSCICRNCNDNLRKGQKDPENFCPRWRKERSTHTICEVSDCNEPVSKSTQLASREEVGKHLECSLNARFDDSNSMYGGPEGHSRLHISCSIVLRDCTLAIRTSNLQSLRTLCEEIAHW